MTTARQPEGQHVVAVPYFLQGHINAMLLVCQQLLPLGFTFTFVNTSHIHRRLQAPRNLELESHGLQAESSIEMVFVEGGIPPEDHAHENNLQRAFMAAQDMKEQVEQLISKVMEERRVAFILTDILFGWSSETANKFQLPWVCFCPVSAATLAACVHFADFAEQGKRIPSPDNEQLDVPVLEGIPGLPVMCLGDVLKAWDETGSLKYDRLQYFHDTRKARFILLNTFEELEGEVVHALAARQYPTVAVGPLLPLWKANDITYTDADRVKARTIRASLFKEDTTCLDWLDKQRPASVLYVSFGSISVRSDEQLEELVQALEGCGCPYLWACKPDVSALKLGCSGRGLIVPWVPQLDVLSHQATGGFLTHCGWNSVTEAVATGVPMLCWADMGERMSNQRFVVRVWKCGLDLVPDGRRYRQHVDEAVVVRREEIEKSIRCLMVEEGGASVRARAARLQDAALAALKDSRSKFRSVCDALLEQDLAAGP